MNRDRTKEGRAVKNAQYWLHVARVDLLTVAVKYDGNDDSHATALHNAAKEFQRCHAVAERAAIAYIQRFGGGVL